MKNEVIEANYELMANMLNPKLHGGAKIAYYVFNCMLTKIDLLKLILIKSKLNAV